LAGCWSSGAECRPDFAACTRLDMPPRRALLD
jgi:hypothetical protein